MVSGRPIDAAVEDLLLRTIIPTELELSLAVEREVDAQAASLEAQWKLRENAKREHRVQLTNEDRRIRALAHDLPAVWRDPTTTPADRKAMLRLVIEAVAIRPIDVPQRLTQIRVQWKTGAVEPRERQLLFEVGFPVADKPLVYPCA